MDTWNEIILFTGL